MNSRCSFHLRVCCAALVGVCSISAMWFSSVAMAQNDDVPWVIGLDADMSAVAVGAGVALRRGAQMAIEDINQQGGVLGRPLALQVRDHRGNPARGVANIKAFAQQSNLVAIIGGVHSPVVINELPTIHELNVILVSAWAAANPITDHEYSPGNTYRVSVRDEHAATVLLQDITSSKVKRVGLLLERTGWGRSNELSMQAVAVKLGLEVTDVQWFNWNQKSMNREITALKSSGAEAVVLVANVPEGVTIVREMAAHPPEDILPIWSHWGIISQTFVDRVGVDNLKRVPVRTLQTVSFIDPPPGSKRAELLRKYQANFGVHHGIGPIPSGVGFAHAYDTVHLLANALKKAGGNDPDKLRAALNDLPPYEGVVKTYDRAFSPAQREALTLSDYKVFEFDSDGRLLPVL